MRSDSAYQHKTVRVEMQSDFEQDTRSIAVEAPDSPALSTAKSTLIDQKMNTAKVTTKGARLSRWLQAVFFAPGMLPPPWSYPIIGYLFAFLGQVTAAAMLAIVPHSIPLFRFPSALMLMVVLLAALGWGVGPSLVATLMGTILLPFLLFSPALLVRGITAEEAAAVFPYVLVGLTISLLISQVQREHMATQRLSQRLKNINEALRVSEERYRTIVETAHEGIWLMDTKGRTLYTNERMAQLLNRKQAELEGHTLLEFVFPEDEIGAKARIANNVRGYTEQFEFRLRRSDNSVLETLASTSPLRDASGTIVGVLGLFTDLTARKQIEEELQHSETLLHMAIRNSPIAIFQQDRNLRYTWMANPPSFTPEAIIGKVDADFVSPEEAAHLTKIKQHVLSSEEGVREEVHIGSEGEGRWELLTIEPLRDRQGSVVGISGTSINITEQKRLEAEQRELEQRTRRALDALLVMARVMVQDGDKDEKERGQDASPARQITRRLAELSRDVLGCERLSLVSIEAGTERIYPLAMVGLESSQEHEWWNGLEQERRYLADNFDAIQVVRLHQQEIVFVDRRQPPWDKQSNPYGIGVMLAAPLMLRTHLIGLLQLDYGGREHTYTSQDIALTQTACRLIALILERERLAQERLEAQANELAAREATNLMEEFLGIVGHELRTPLTTIKASVQLARRNLNRIKQQEETLPPNIVPLLTTVRGLLERTERQVGLQNRLVSDLLDVSRIQAGKLELHLKVHTIGKVVRQVVEDQQSLTPERTIRIEIPSQDTLQVLADEDRLRQVITNYLSNALKYSETEKPVEIRVELEANSTQVRVTVKDEGPGLSAQQQQRIWERFYRVPEIEVKSGSGVGLGLGLPISRMLIERQGGEVGVQSKPGQGSAFWFTLPIAKEEGE